MMYCSSGAMVMRSSGGTRNSLTSCVDSLTWFWDEPTIACCSETVPDRLSDSEDEGRVADGLGEVLRAAGVGAREPEYLDDLGEVDQCARRILPQACSRAETDWATHQKWTPLPAARL